MAAEIRLKPVESWGGLHRLRPLQSPQSTVQSPQSETRVLGSAVDRRPWTDGFPEVPVLALRTWFKTTYFRPNQPILLS